MPADKPVYLSADQWRRKIEIELNGGSLLQQYIRLLWDGNDRFARTPFVQYLYTKNDAIDLLLGNLDELESFPVEGDQAARLASRRSILFGLKRTIEDRLARIGFGVASYGPAVGVLTATAPIPSPSGAPDANDPLWRGDPNTRPWWEVTP